ncbi:chemotaxis protein chel [Rhodobacteraceae bacterium Araon29]
MTDFSTLPSLSTPPKGAENEIKMRKIAQQLEGCFLAEMLKAAKFGQIQKSYNGGAGEEQFQSFLTQEHAQAIARTQSIGLAEHIFLSLKAGGQID